MQSILHSSYSYNLKGRLKRSIKNEIHSDICHGLYLNKMLKLKSLLDYDFEKNPKTSAF